MRTSITFVGFSILLVLAPFFAYAGTHPVWNRTLSFGLRGSDVIELQNILIAQGDLATGNNTGYFGRLTEAAVQKFQCRSDVVCHGSLLRTGYGAVGPRTLMKILEGFSRVGSATPSSGLYGKITKTTGNCMPRSVDSNYSVTSSNTCGTSPVSRTLYVYPTLTGPLGIARPFPNPIAVTSSNENGSYMLSVPAGSYSIFVDDDGVKYCNLLSDGSLCPVTISNAQLQYDININAATW